MLPGTVERRSVHGTLSICVSEVDSVGSACLQIKVAFLPHNREAHARTHASKAKPTTRPKAGRGGGIQRSKEGADRERANRVSLFLSPKTDDRRDKNGYTERENNRGLAPASLPTLGPSDISQTRSSWLPAKRLARQTQCDRHNNTGEE